VPLAMESGDREQSVRTFKAGRANALGTVSSGTISAGIGLSAFGEVDAMLIGVEHRLPCMCRSARHLAILSRMLRYDVDGVYANSLWAAGSLRATTMRTKLACSATSDARWLAAEGGVRTGG
jgi:hypothetical protein